jgi:predicted small metal-binding protein
MPKVLRCGDVMPGCAAVLEGRDDAEVMKKVTDHAKSAHGMATVPPDVVNKVRAAIKTK